MKFLLISVILIQKLSIILAQDENNPDNIICPPNQEVGCSNYCLEKTCGNIFYTGEPPRMCALYCIIGCVCRGGFVLAIGSLRNCVPISTCPKICCPVNRVYKDCGPFGPRSCDNREHVICNDKDNCNMGCFCREGLIEDGFGNCIQAETCPLQCGENEIEDPCTNANQPTCSNPNPSVCDPYDCLRTCVCKPPYIKNEITGQCVDRNTCDTPPCPTNEVYKDSGFDCWTCSNYKIVRCAAITTPQCFCVDDYVRHDKTRQCIPKSECPAPVCGKYEDYKVGPNCQDCNNYATVLCLPINEKLCICKSGFVRHPITNACTLIEDCPVCPPNQIFNNDGNRDCQTCSNWQTVDCKPNSTPGCYCVDDFVHKDEKTRDCISTQACPKSICGVNEVFADEGVDGVTCENYTYVKIAPQQISKCYCILDYVRNAQNICTAKEDCP